MSNTEIEGAGLGDGKKCGVREDLRVCITQYKCYKEFVIMVYKKASERMIHLLFAIVFFSRSGQI